MKLIPVDAIPKMGGYSVLPGRLLRRIQTVLLAAEQEEGLTLRIVDVAVRQCYRFNCPNCGSKLEADCDELVDIGGKTSQFWCPVCRKDRYVPWSALRKRTVYEDKSAE